MKKMFWMVPAIVAGLVLSVTARFVYAQACTISTVAGNGDRLNVSNNLNAEAATEIGIGEPVNVEIDHEGNVVFAVEPAEYHLARITPSGGLEQINVDGNGYCSDFAFSPSGDLYCFAWPNNSLVSSLLRYPPEGGAAVEELTDEASYEGGLAIDSRENVYFFGGVQFGDNPGERRTTQIKKITPDRTVSVIFDTASGLGIGGPAFPAPFDIDQEGNLYFQADGGLKKLGTNGVLTEYIENFRFLSLTGIAVGNDGSVFYNESGTVKKLAPDGTISTVAGGATGFSGDGGPAIGAGLNQPRDVAVDSNGNIYIADKGNNRIRKVTCPHEADLSVSLEARVLMGRLNFTSIVNNDGPEVATNVVLVNNLPSGFSMVESYPVGMCSGTTTVTCNLGNMDVGQIRRITISTVAPLKGPRRKVTDRVNVSSEEISDPNMANNRASVTRVVP